MNIVELFAGSRLLSDIAEKKGHNVFTIDWTNFKGIDLCVDIGDLKKEDVPFIPDIVWASPDCTTYSIAACSTHRNIDKTAKSDYAKKCDSVNINWLSLLDQWLEINPNLIFFIENPRGNLRHMEFMKKYNRHTVWYCQYGDIRAKPTDIWTNSKTWKPKPMCKNYKYDHEGHIIDKHCHHESARRGAKTGTQGLKGSYNRSKIPEKLINEILESLE